MLGDGAAAMNGSRIAEGMTAAERSGTGFPPTSYEWDDLDFRSGGDLSGAKSWIGDIQVVEIVAVLGGLAALVSSLASCFS
jgi:hypothetical protein